jgi:hypothetical protein
MVGDCSVTLDFYFLLEHTLVVRSMRGLCSTLVHRTLRFHSSHHHHHHHPSIHPTLTRIHHLIPLLTQVWAHLLLGASVFEDQRFVAWEQSLNGQDDWDKLGAWVRA